ncbi:hypothetical protein FXN65_10650 [Metapseudomonas lalkuanensis]|uniref:Uncharacterized protein n=1 Tax=Metapseudomonas lalkuanensis TaxID=2604832 RepID=A0A5J6QLJ5_9GAMM|nr:hypothetical protein [Pseudomonas lalkuanensis]QEY62512.1 hypothetical protein FXN65_10650 [Pseudomonas lalkuanensis]
MISHELSAVEANSRTSAMLAFQVEQFLAAGGRIHDLGETETAPMPLRREIEPAPKASKKARNIPPKEYMDREGRREAKRKELAPQVRELAKTLNISQIAARLGVSRRMLDTIGRDFQITFKPAPTGAQLAAMERDRVLADRLLAFIAIGLTKRQACMRSGMGYKIFNRVCKAYGLQFPTAVES